jgi:hypothetical protein
MQSNPVSILEQYHDFDFTMRRIVTITTVIDPIVMIVVIVSSGITRMGFVYVVVEDVGVSVVVVVVVLVLVVACRTFTRTGLTSTDLLHNSDIV